MSDAPSRLRFLRILDGMPFEIEIGPARADASAPWRPACTISGGDRKCREFSFRRRQ